ncbi:MAG: DinB family protein, partial [Tepidiformaceae bacterium]
MGATGESLAAKVEATNNELLETVEGLSDEQWAMKCADEGWPVGVTAHHVAESLAAVTGLVQAVANGAQVPPFTMEMLDKGNAEHAVRAANVTKAETAKLLRENIAAGSAALRGLQDDQFEKSATMPAGEMSAAQLVEGIMVGHAGMHLAGIKAA